MERENEMIVISHRLFVLTSSAGDGKRIEDRWVKERGRTVFRKIAEKWDLLPLQAVCRKGEEADPVSSIPDLYTVIDFFYFIFYGRLDRYFPLLPFHEVRIEGEEMEEYAKVHR